MLFQQFSTAQTLPQITEMTVYGSGGGMAPFSVNVRVNIDGSGWTNATNYTIGSIVDHYDIAKSTTFRCIENHTSDYGTRPGDGSSWKTKWALHSDSDSGFWPEGRWFFKFTKSDGSKLDQSDRDKMYVVDPIINSGVFLDEIYSAAPCAGYTFYSSGTYKVWARYQNSRKVWSNWLESAPITVAPNTRTKRYVNGNTGSDVNDGTSPASAKATLSGALSLVNANNFEIEIKDDTSCSGGLSYTAIDNRSGIYIHRSNDGNMKPVIHIQTDSLAIGTNAIVDGLKIYDGTFTIATFGFGTDKTNISLLNCDYDSVNSFCEINSGDRPKGVLFYKCTQINRVGRYFIYMDAFDCLNIIGCNLQGGSTSEHVIRLASGSKYASIVYSIISYNGSSGRSKSALRAYIKNLGIYRSCLSSGTVSLGNIDLKGNPLEVYGNYCIDQCSFDFSSSDAPLTQITLWEDTHRIVIRNSLIVKVDPYVHPSISIAERAGGGAGVISGVQILNCSMFRSGIAQYGSFGGDFPAQNFIVRGNIFQHDMSAFTWGHRIGISSGAEQTMSWIDNVHSEYLGAGYEFNASGVNISTIDDAMLSPWADNLIEENHTFNSLGQPLGTGIQWKTLSNNSIGVFKSLNNKEWLSDGIAGCWRESGVV